MQKNAKNRMSLSKRLLLSIGITTSLAFALSIAFLGYRSYTVAKTNAREMETQACSLYGIELSSALDNGIVVSKNMSLTIQGLMEDNADVTREDLISILKSVLKKNPQILAMGLCFEPNAFDGKDNEYKDKPPYHDATGRFIPYIYRANGEIHGEPLVGYDNETDGEYYYRPLREDRQVIVKPYFYEVGGKEIYMTTICLPIKVKNKNIGVVTFDIGLSDIAEQAANLKPMGDGKVMIASPTGDLIAHPDFDKIGTNIDEANQSNILKDVARGETVFLKNTIEDIEMQSVFMPLNLRGQTEPWVMGISVPEKTVMASARKTLKWAIIISIVSILILLGITISIIHKTVNGITHITSSLRMITSEVNAASEQVAKVGERQAHIASDIAGNLTDTSSSVEEFTSMTRQNSENSNIAAKLMEEAIESLNNTNENIEKLTTSMSEIKNASNETQRIIKTIDEIAFQTNILALNAAVEAARAGEAGAGFAVVADEVRNLAQQAGNASRSTAALVEDSARKTQDGDVLVELVSTDFAKIHKHVTDVSDLISEIACASDEQAQGADDINSAVAQASETTQSTAAIAEESSASGQELQAQAISMAENIEDLSNLILGSSRIAKNETKRLETNPMIMLEN
jgi:methyl-accepting chemotaxis protein